MKFLTATILTALISFIAGLYFSWWSLAIVAFGIALLIHQRPLKAFFSGFLGLFLLWGGLALLIDLKNDHILSKRVAELMKLGQSSIAIILVTALIAALVAGFAALSGSYLRSSPAK
jgi:hypothetical protein